MIKQEEQLLFPFQGLACFRMDYGSLSSVIYHVWFLDGTGVGSKALIMLYIHGTCVGGVASVGVLSLYLVPASVQVPYSSRLYI